MKQNLPGGSGFADLVARAARFRIIGSTAFLLFGACGPISTATHSVLLAGVALLAFVVFMVVLANVWFAHCPACGANFFNRTLSFGPFWSYGPWGAFRRHPKCVNCGYPDHGRPDSIRGRETATEDYPNKPNTKQLEAAYAK